MKKYAKSMTDELIFPLGGIGTGSIGLRGNGSLVDFEIFNCPNKGSLNGYTHIAVKAKTEDGSTHARVLIGDRERELMGTYQQSQYAGYGYGPNRLTMIGFPHFPKHRFTGDFPFAKIKFEDEKFPLGVTLDAWSPFIPTDSKNSSLPVAIFTVNFHNPSDSDIRATAAFSLANPYPDARNRILKDGKGVLLTSDGKQPPARGNGNMTLLTTAKTRGAVESWYRGGWMDGISTYWRQFTECDRLPERHYDEKGKKEEETTTVWAEELVPAHTTKSVTFILAWYHPHYFNTWDAGAKDENGDPLYWRNWYATVFKNSEQIARYVCRHRNTFYRASRRFADAMNRATLPDVVKEAAKSTLAVLKSPTVLRLEDGTFWGWEGVHEKRGSCEGTCTHVWNYAYALPFLFPDLERSIRRADYRYNLADDGSCRFRLPLPPTKERGWRMPCADGQFGGIIKTYREWKLSGDDAFLREMWQDVKRAMEFTWREDSLYGWDKNRDGVLEGRQHHTLDMELFGPSGWLEGFYLAALKAGAEMARAMGEEDTANEWLALFQKGSEYTEKTLFNGKYYAQSIDLSDRELLSRYDNGDVYDRYWNEEAGEIKYQIADGCNIDQLCGQWHADIVGLGDIFDPENRKTALKSLFANNFHESQRDIYNCWRNYVVNDEAGACICSYPDGTYKPATPIPYTEECMHGFEYELAGLLISHGMVDEGVAIVKGVRDRYDGRKRNPYNEMECGSNYARSMAAFALLPLFSGFSFDMTECRIGFDPVVPSPIFRVPFGVADSFSSITIEEKGAVIDVLFGKLPLAKISLPHAEAYTSVIADGISLPFTCENGTLVFPKTVVNKSIVFKK